MKKVFVFSKAKNGQIHREEIELSDMDIIIQSDINKKALEYLKHNYAISDSEVNWLIENLLCINPINNYIQRDLEGIIIHAKENNKSLEDSFHYITQFESRLLHP